MNICFLGNDRAGILGLLTVLAMKHKITTAIGYHYEIKDIMDLLHIPNYSSVGDKDFVHQAEQSDLLLCVHGREILNKYLLDAPKYGCVNIHPYLSRFKGANPVRRAIEKEVSTATVGAHFMTEELDEGKIIYEEYTKLDAKNKTEEEVYNALYPIYVNVIIKTLNSIKQGVRK